MDSVGKEVQRSNLVSLADLRSKLSVDQRLVLNLTWKHFEQNDSGIPIAALYQHLAKEALELAVRGLGGSIIIESTNGRKRYTLTFLGCLLTDDGTKVEGLLSDFLSFLRARLIRDIELDQVTSEEVESSIGLSRGDSMLLGRVIRLSPFAGGGSFSKGSWTMGLPQDVDDLIAIDDLTSYVRSRATMTFDRDIPASGIERYHYLNSNRVMLTVEPRRRNPAKVFVVYGRNERARRALFDFLRSISLEPQEWSQWVQSTDEGSPYVGEILKRGFEEAQAFVILMTPDDEARLREQLRGADEERHEIDLTPQPRPNVIYEAGMAMGIDEKRTILIELGKLRPISDVFGRHVVRINNSPERRNDLAQRLRNAGCPINTKGQDWLTVGDFDAALEGL